MLSLRTLGALLVGGFVGTVLRALLADAWAHDPTAWPWATLTVNVVGSLLLGVVVAMLRARPTAPLLWRPLLATGLCGGLTTFSTMQLELVRMAESDAAGRAAAYLAVSVGLGLVAVAAGLRLGAAAPGAVGVRDPVALPGAVPVEAAMVDHGEVERGRG